MFDQVKLGLDITCVPYQTIKSALPWRNDAHGKYWCDKNGIHYEFIPERKRVWIGFNGAELIHGNNYTLLNADTLPRVLGQVERQIRGVLEWAPSILQWDVTSIEYPVHYRCLPEEREEWRAVLSMHRIPYMLVDLKYMKEGTVSFKGKRRKQLQEKSKRQPHQKPGCEIVVYDKYKQVLDKHGIELEQLRSVIRIEMRYHDRQKLKRAIGRFFGRKSKATLEECLHPIWLHDVYRRIDLLVEQCRPMSPTELRKVMKRSEWSNTVINNSIKFLRKLNREGLQRVYRENPQKYNREKKKLWGVGLPLLPFHRLHQLEPFTADDSQDDKTFRSFESHFNTKQSEKTQVQ